MTRSSIARVKATLLLFLLTTSSPKSVHGRLYGKNTTLPPYGGFMASTANDGGDASSPQPETTTDGGSNRRATFRAGQVVIKGTPGALQTNARTSGLFVQRYYKHANLTVVTVARGQESEQVQSLRQLGVQAELNRLASPSLVPNDEHYNKQWNLPKVQAEQAWDVTKGRNDVVVAVLDTGLRTAGAVDGIGCVKPGYNVINDNNNVDEKHGHGTFVAGIIGQKTNNDRKGVAGLAYEACIMPVKVLSDIGSLADSADIVEGLAWAIANGANVINLSYSYDLDVTSDQFIDEQLRKAYEQGITVVAPSGNDGSSVSVSYPSSFPTVISVGATDFQDRRSAYSNYGVGLDLVAPGGDLLSDRNGDNYPDGILQETVVGFDGSKFAYEFLEGTSLASAHVAAAAALIIAYELNRGNEIPSPDKIKSSLKKTAKEVDGCPTNQCGAGLLQVWLAMLDLRRTGDDPPTGEFAFFESHAGEGDPNKDKRWCLTARNGVGSGKSLGLLPCEFTNRPAEQLFKLETDGQIRTGLDSTRCLVVGRGQGIRGGARIKFIPCNPLSPGILYNTFEYDALTKRINVAQNPTFCLHQTGNRPQKTDTIRVNKCGIDPGFQFDLLSASSSLPVTLPSN